MFPLSTASSVDCKRLSLHTCAAEAAPAGEAGAEGAADAEPAAEEAPAAEEGEEGGETGPPKPDYSKNMLEYVVASSGQVRLNAQVFQPSTYGCGTRLLELSYALPWHGVSFQLTVCVCSRSTTCL